MSSWELPIGWPVEELPKWRHNKADSCHGRESFGPGTLHTGHMRRGSQKTTPRQSGLCLAIRGRVWLLLHGQAVRRLPGNWPDHNRFLQLHWERTRQPGDPLSWQVKAQQRQEWRDWTSALMQQKGLMEVGFYPSWSALTCVGVA